MIIMERTALQLYSVKELTGNDFLGTIKKVAEIGYDGVEFAGFFDTSAKDLKTALEAYGVKAAGSHEGINKLRDTLDYVIEYNQTIENPYVICPGLPKEMVSSMDKIKETCELFNKIGEKCYKNGLSFGYHNHAFEFEKVENKYIYDLFMEYTDPKLMFIELDTFWVEYSGLRSVDIISKYAQRCRLIHVKEMKSLTEKVNTEVGRGIMDFKAITDMAKKYKSEWYIVEQEHFEIPYLESITESLTNLKKILA
jgi:sugar phosphate isomerase/epimerase